MKKKQNHFLNNQSFAWIIKNFLHDFVQSNFKILKKIVIKAKEFFSKKHSKKKQNI